MVFGSRHCFVCDAVNITDFPQHMSNHVDDLKMFKFSNNTIDNCKTACKVCGEVFPLTSMRNHTKSRHNLPITEYKAKFNQQFFDIVEKVFHRCGLCELPILLDSDSIASHINSSKNSHPLSHREYNERFLNRLPSSVTLATKMVSEGPLASLEKRTVTIKLTNTIAAVVEKSSKEREASTAASETFRDFISWLSEDRLSPGSYDASLACLEVLQATQDYCR